jgi:hypothetical protein
MMFRDRHTAGRAQGKRASGFHRRATLEEDDGRRRRTRGRGGGEVPNVTATDAVALFPAASKALAVRV